SLRNLAHVCAHTETSVAARIQEPRFSCVGGLLADSIERNIEMSVTEKIDAKQVKELRDKSGAPMGDCLKALQEAKGNIEEAFVVLRKRGMASAQKKASRSTNDGSVYPYIHAGGKLGVLVEVNCESDFVARTEDFQDLLKDIAMHIAASDPRYIRPEDVT